MSFEYSFGTVLNEQSPDPSNLILTLQEQEKGHPLNQLGSITFLMTSKAVKSLTVKDTRQGRQESLFNLKNIIDQFIHFSRLEKVVFDIPIQGEIFKKLASSLDKETYDFNARLKAICFNNIHINTTKEQEYLDLINQYKNYESDKVKINCQITKQKESTVVIPEIITKTDTFTEFDLKEIPMISEIITDKSEPKSHLFEFSSKDNLRAGPALIWSSMNNECILLKYLFLQYKEKPTAEMAHFIMDTFSLADFKLKIDTPVKKEPSLNFINTLFRSFSSPSTTKKKSEGVFLTSRANSAGKEEGLRKNTSIFKSVFKKSPLQKEDSFIESNLVNVESCLEIKKQQKIAGHVDFFEEIETNMHESLQKAINGYENHPTPISPSDMDPIFKVKMKRFCSEAQRKAGITFPKAFLQAFIFMLED